MNLREMEIIRDERGGHFHCVADCEKAAFVVREDGELVCYRCGSAMVECTPKICGETVMDDEVLNNATKVVGTTRIPRRVRVDLMSPAELAIRNAIIMVELSGANVHLTDAVNLLHNAQESVADYIDGQREFRRYAVQKPYTP